jgi:sugar phosphate permease
MSTLPWWRSLRWQIATLLFLATTINYIDRQSISVAAPVISKEFGFTATDYSWIVFSFLFAYAVMQVVAGGLIDRMEASAEVNTRHPFDLHLKHDSGGGI